MKPFKEFDLLESPLQGTNLIEAGAGTGKTYTITGLFLRLLLEERLPVHKILVVTFTEAATSELRDRIRSRVCEAGEAFSRGGSEDAFLDALVKKPGLPANASDLLREALRNFDQAAIFTIHGFCRRILYENAFESGSLFDAELVTDEESIKREIVEDFWRKYFYEASPLFIHYAQAKGFGLDGFVKLLGNKASQPYLKIIPQADIVDTSVQEHAYQEAFAKVRNAWEASKAEVQHILENDPGLNRGKYKKTSISGWIQSMNECLNRGANHPILFKEFSKFTSGELQSAVKKGQVPPAHLFFDHCEDLKRKHEALETVLEQRLLGLKIELFHYARNELARRKQEKNLLSFDDLLIRLHDALKGKQGEVLATILRAKFRAALIDEFQDTDPIQYFIFKKVFGVKESILFLIGDPKQAIYGFRGADIFAYMDAGRSTESRYTLTKNWRSDPRLIEAVNALFGNAEPSFIYKEISFEPAVSGKETFDPLLIDEHSDPPFQIWFLNAAKVNEGKPITREQAQELIPGAVAAEISRLLGLARTGKALLGTRPLREGDMAVLIRENREARLMQEALSLLRIPSVTYSTANLFDSREAMEMERLLIGIAEPHHEGRLKAALATDMIGVHGEELAAWMEDDAKWDEWLLRFRKYHDVWNEQGFIRMFRRLTVEEGILPRLMAFADGERRNTNVLHLAEVLHQVSTEKKLGMSALLKWLSEQRNPDAQRLDEHQLRLESDENAVKLVTIHKSKGLEYPVVFCPFTWGHSRLRDPKGPFTFHDENDGRRATFDLGSPNREANRVFAEKEQLAENLRLLYVALTRAKNRCIFVWGRFNKAETSAPAYLLHCPKPDGSKSVVDAVADKFQGLTDADLLSGLEGIRSKAPEAVTVSEMTTETGTEQPPVSSESARLICPEFNGAIDRSWRVSSFSALTSDQSHRTELPDCDDFISSDRDETEISDEAAPEEKPLDIFSFPKGAKAGIFLHDLFEHLDFTQGDPASTGKPVQEKLRAYGFEETWRDTICTMIQKVLSAPLERDRRDFTLSRLRNGSRLNELEFYFPLKPISPGRLRDLFRNHGGSAFPEQFPERIGRLNFSPVRGFMKGFIDMVFEFEGRYYLVDWKSNFLGDRVEDYDREALVAVMERESYFLQYLLYSVALDQYLRVRLPGYTYEAHFGGIYYIFLRGVNGDKGSDFGIYRDRPPGEWIKRLRTSLIDVKSELSQTFLTTEPTSRQG